MPAVRLDRRAPAAVLLVEDELALANRVHALLAQVGGRRLWVWHERTAAGMCRMLSVCRFRAILLDFTLPDGAPGAVLRRVKKVAPDTPLLVLIGDRGMAGEEVSRRHARLFGAAAVLRKGEDTCLLRALHDVLRTPTPPVPAACAMRPPDSRSSGRMAPQHGSDLDLPAFNWIAHYFELSLTSFGSTTSETGLPDVPAGQLQRGS